jgi:DNA-binding MarR family transcriptional regulator
MPEKKSDTPPPLIGALLRFPSEYVKSRMLEALHEAGFNDLSVAHLVVLRYPGPEGRRPSELAANSGMTKQAVNYQLGQLEELGYLNREGGGGDQRSRIVRLTDRGQKTIPVIRESVSNVEREWAAELGEADLEQLRSLLIRVNDLLD